MEVKAAICQRPPVLLDKKASIAAALAMVAEAAGQGARLMTFPAAFLPGYPTFPFGRVSTERGPAAKAAGGIPGFRLAPTQCAINQDCGP
ncbi:MAG: hypothetical protein K8F90_03045 [Hyphomicrobiales bacterium]|nr:hypothetical protein [Hyphomicrobiales bacterium]